MGSTRVSKVISVSVGSMSMYGLTLGDVADWVARAMANGAARDAVISGGDEGQIRSFQVSVAIIDGES